MPISKINQKRYPRNWKQISERIRFERAGNKCEVCGVENGKAGWRVSDGTLYSAQEFSEDYIPPEHEEQLLKIVAKNKRETVVVLTVAHLDHQPENCADDNLKAMCQRCHNQHDQPHRQANAKKTRESKKFCPLFPA